MNGWAFLLFFVFLSLIAFLNRKANLKETKNVARTKATAYYCSVLGMFLLVLPTLLTILLDDSSFLLGAILVFPSFFLILIGYRKYKSLMLTGINPSRVLRAVNAVNVLSMAICVPIILFDGLLLFSYFLSMLSTYS